MGSGNDMREPQLLVRDMEARDLTAVRGLLAQLGYEIGAEEVARRFAAVERSATHALTVAEADGDVAGFVHVFARPALEKPLEAVVQAMAVDRARRRRGFGRALLAFAEHWAREHGFRSVALASEVGCADAYAFYTRLGYAPTATSRLFRKPLDF